MGSPADRVGPDHRRTWTEAESRQADQWAAEGHQASWIAARMGRTLKSVQNRIYRSRQGMIGAKGGGTYDREHREVIPCMCCHDLFPSWDRQRNRLCQNCGREGLTRFDTDHRTLRTAKGFRGE